MRRGSVFVVETLERRQLLTGVGDLYTPPASPRLEVDLQADWRFIRQDVTGAQGAGFDDNSWANISLPHTWNAIDGTDGGNNYYRGVGWYRTTVDLPDTFTNKRVFLEFGAASIKADIWINGQSIGSHLGSFAGFRFDVTSHVSDEPFILAVKLDNSASLLQTAPPQGGDYTVYGGLYRDVKLVAMDDRHVEMDNLGGPGVRFTTPAVSSSSATANIITRVSNDSTQNRSTGIRTLLVNADGVVVGASNQSTTINAGQTVELTASQTINNPRLWHGRADPYLHDLYIEVYDPQTSQLLDLKHQRVGIRSAVINANGFYLNGQKYELNGVNMHQDRAGKGWAVSAQDIAEDVQMVYDMGATIIRTAHYQHSQTFFNLANEKGLVVWAEGAVNGSITSGNSPTNAAFRDNAAREMRELVRQNYNHPSIVVWGLFNELVNNANNRTLVTALQNAVKLEDTTRPTVGASWSTVVDAVQSIADIIGFNRYFGWKNGQVSDLQTFLANMRTQHPSLAQSVSEYGAGSSLHQRQETPAPIDIDGLYHPQEAQMRFHEQTWPILESAHWLWSRVLWQMFDSGADNRTDGTPGINDKGLVSFDRQTKKDSYYYYQANWSSVPMLHVPGADWVDRNAGSIEVKAYSNLSSLTISINGQPPVAMTKSGVVFTTQVPLAPGETTIVIRGQSGSQVFEQTLLRRYEPQPIGTRIVDHTPAVATSTISLPLPSGEYYVRVSSTNGTTNRVNNLMVENRRFIDGNGFSSTDSFVMRLAVTDGTLNISPAPGAIAPIVSRVEIFSGEGVAVGAQVSGTVYHDLNSNGSRDPGEPGIAGLTIYLDLDNDRILDANEQFTVTDANGQYLLSDIPPASSAARVRAVVPAHYTQVAPANNFGHPIDSNTFATNPDKHFGLRLTAINGATAWGIVYSERLMNGILDDIDYPLANVLVFIDLNNDRIHDPNEQYTFTDANGRYEFSHIPPAGTAARIRARVPHEFIQLTPGNNFGYVLDSTAEATNDARHFAMLDTRRIVGFDPTPATGLIPRAPIRINPGGTVGGGSLGAILFADRALNVLV